MHVPWGASLFYLKSTILWWSLEFNSLGIFCFEWYYGSDDSMFVHFILQCKFSSFVHKPWGAYSYYLEQSSWSYHNIYLSFGIFFVVHLVACFICWSFLNCYLLAIFDPLYSVIPFEYSSLDTCIWFHSNYEKCTRYGGTLTIFAF